MTDSPRNAAIVTSTLHLAHALGLVLVAEGVEDQATLEALTQLGCDVVQGYHLSRPLPPTRVLAWLRERTVVTSGHDRGALNGGPRHLATVARS